MGSSLVWRLRAVLSVVQGFGMVTLTLGAALWSRDPAAKSQGIYGSCCWCGLQPAHGQGSKGSAPNPRAALGVMPVILGVGSELWELWAAWCWRMVPKIPGRAGLP